MLYITTERLIFTAVTNIQLQKNISSVIRAMIIRMVSLWLLKNLISLEKALCKRPIASLDRYVHE